MELTKTKTDENFFPSIFTDFFDNDRFFGKGWTREMSVSLPAVNVIENESEFRVEFAAPGFDKNDFKISADENTLTISAEKKEDKKTEKGNFTRREFSYNSFSRSFLIPQNVLAGNTSAQYTNGILSLTLPKKKEENKTGKKEITVS